MGFWTVGVRQSVRRGNLSRMLASQQSTRRRIRVQVNAPGGPYARRLIRNAQEALDSTNGDLQFSRTLRFYVRRSCRIRGFRPLSIIIGSFIGYMVFWVLGGVANSFAAGAGWPSIKQMGAGTDDQLTTSQSLFFYGTTTGGFLVASGLGYLAARAMNYELGEGSAGGYRTLQPLLLALAACKEEDPETSELSAQLVSATKAVRRAYARRNTVPFVSHRRKALRRHAALIVSVLRAAEASLDLDPPAARAEIARLLHTISERFAEARVGNLLDESDLAGVEPAHNWEPLRFALLAVAAPFVTWLPAALRFPDGARVPAASAGILLLAISLYGRTWPEALSRARSILPGGGTGS
jgi:hypothetical protein